MQDLRYGFRLLRRSPVFTGVAVGMLAVGIGASTSIFSALDGVLLRPLPYAEPDRLVQVCETLPDGSINSVSGGAFRDWSEHQTQLDSLALVHSLTGNLRSGGDVERVDGLEVTHEFLDVLGVAPLRGRGFRPADDGVGGNNHVVLLTEEFWRSHFGADETVLGRTITIDDVACEVVGIVPAGSWFFRDPKFFVPAVLDPANNDRASRFSHWADVYGRMKAGVSVAQLDAELKAIKRRLAPEYPDYKQDWNVRVLPLGPTLAENPRPVLFILAGAVALVLLIVAANVANLLLARASRRRREIALRAALGATGRRLVRQTLTESLLLAFLGGAGGAFLSWWGVRAIGRLSADLVPAAMAPQLDVRVLLVSLLLTCGTGVLFGVLPALQARRLALNDALKVGGHGGSAGRPRSQSALVVAELALSVVLLAGAGLAAAQSRARRHLRCGHQSRPRADVRSFAVRRALSHARKPGGVYSGGGRTRAGGPGRCVRRIDHRDAVSRRIVWRILQPGGSTGNAVRSSRAR